ncbi:dihydrolipoyl dehydrogenase [Macrococcus epidermidis]|uniref:Dihydrolipoyl dehydrogenase n=1 Tax=Macrococcus epidermidis TaxID=1902580 RepID=A0A327ZRM5_9STAP|nr:dihydrolipoyl dehydrogenase [Macrococcus epidermidis]RAK43708.1 dihydrolipoyl dehydrogenase [Macrococcus epidermidis]
MKYNYDVAIIGGGPGGYVTAIRLAQFNKKVILFEGKNLGGTCLNVGCIPSKAMLRISEVMSTIKEAEKFGIITNEVKVDYSKVKSYKEDVVKQLVNGVGYLLKKNGVKVINEFVTEIKDHDIKYAENKVSAENIILATGSQPFIPPIEGLNSIQYDTTDTIFTWKTLPKSLVIIGGGVIGVEMAQAFAPLGAKVTLVEVADDILMTEDQSARKLVEKHLKQEGITIITKAKISKIEKDEITVGNETIPFEKILIATGRKTNLELAEQLGLELSENKKFIEVNDYMQTSQKHIYAIGDIIPGYQLAHAASHEGLIAADYIANNNHHKLDQTKVPRCVYTTPEIASFGLSEEQAKKDYDVKVSTYNLAGNGKAISYGDSTGFVKVISEKKYGEILGAVICGAHATELISTILAVKNAEGTMDELAHQIFAHPTVSESIGESAEDFFGLSIHQP